MASLSLELFGVLESVLYPYRRVMPGASYRDVLFLLVLVPQDALLFLLGVLLLSYYQFAVLVVVLEDALSGLPLRSAADDSAADDSVASEIGKHHFLARAELSQSAELVRDGHLQPFDHLGCCAELMCCSPEWYAELYKSYCRCCDR